jgi:integrase
MSETPVIDIIPRGDEDTGLTKTRENVKKREQRKYRSNEYIWEHVHRIEKPRDKMFIIATYLTGLRVTEVINLRKRDLDFKRREITARWQKNKKWKNRTVAMHKKLVTPLQLYTSPLSRDDLVFDFTRQTGYNITKKHLDISPHQLRHSFAMHVLDNVDDSLGIVKLSRCLGHSNVRTTMEYLKINPKAQKEFLDEVPF